MSECPLCSIKPYFYDDRIDGLTWNKYASSKILASGSGPWLIACKDPDNRLALHALCDDGAELYYPKFCPECGRKLECQEN